MPVWVGLGEFSHHALFSSGNQVEFAPSISKKFAALRQNTLFPPPSRAELGQIRQNEMSGLSAFTSDLLKKLYARGERPCEPMEQKMLQRVVRNGFPWTGTVTMWSERTSYACDSERTNMFSSLARALRRGSIRMLLMGLLAMPGSSALGQTGPEPSNEDLMKQVEALARQERAMREQLEAEQKSEREQREAELNQKNQANRDQREKAASPLEQALREQKALQDSLLRKANGQDPGREQKPAPEAATAYENDLSGTSPRIAGLAPQDRILPEEIFDHSKQEIPPGTWNNADRLRVIRLVLDADADGKPELIRFIDRDQGTLIRQESDRNYDGILDSWHQYEAGQLVTRVLDENDDGNPEVFETYRDGRVSLRELDRDDDGVRDVFYRYRGDSLVEERHDANNDGTIDLVMIYEKRMRVRTEEDTDQDGQMDLWTRYVHDGPLEKVGRIERDTKGGGFADTFEIFESQNGETLLARREQDLNGDGEIDVVSFYVGGKLVRRQIRDSDLVPLS